MYNAIRGQVYGLRGDREACYSVCACDGVSARVIVCWRRDGGGDGRRVFIARGVWRGGRRQMGSEGRRKEREGFRNCGGDGTLAAEVFVFACCGCGRAGFHLDSLGSASLSEGLRQWPESPTGFGQVSSLHIFSRKKRE